ncbi:MAG: quinone oxidoreductase family protein [Myxococcota bacterium]
MSSSISGQMTAVTIDHFGGPEVLHPQRLPVPAPKDDEVLIRLQSAGVGVWDPSLREGEFELGKGGFPKILGNDGAGTVVAVGKKVSRFKEGDRVYAYSYEGQFYAEYVAVKEEDVAPVPKALSTEEAGALGADGITALRGLEDELQLRPGQSLMVFGASGGIGHLAVQLAKRMGARVLAVASGADGLELVKKLGADAVVEGHRGDVAAAMEAFAPGGLDAALALAGGKELDAALKRMKKGGRVAYPNGVEPVPEVPQGVERRAYDGVPSPEAFARLNQLIAHGPFHVTLGHVYPLEEAAQAHRDVLRHHLGKLALRLRPS